MAREYPDLARVAPPTARRIHSHLQEAVAGMGQAIDLVTVARE
ncbi:hypothetical protein [Mesorhizobium sp. M1005]